MAAVNGVCMLLCFLAACFGAGSTYMPYDEDDTIDTIYEYDDANPSSNFTHRTTYPGVHTPGAWICLTTSGGKV